jgi:hypothetical protein
VIAASAVLDPVVVGGGNNRILDSHTNVKQAKHGWLTLPFQPALIPFYTRTKL